MRSKESFEKMKANAKAWYHDHKNDPEYIARRKRWESTPRYKAMRRASAKKWAEQNPDRVLHNRVMRMYGISGEEFMELMNAQAGRCAICKQEFADKPRSINVDHDHKSGHVRGLLCGKCNLALGHFGDSEVTLLSAVSYLRKRSILESVA